MNTRRIKKIEDHISRNKDFYFLVIVSLKIRLIYSIMTDNYYYGGDIFVRMSMAYNLNPLNSIMTGFDWTPGHVWLLKIFAEIFQDYIYAPRLVGIISDSLSTGFIYILGRKFFTRKVGLCAAFIHATYFLNVVLSSVTLSGTLFTSILLGALILLLKYLKNKNKTLLLLFSVLLAYASWVRYEAWPINFMIGTFLIYKKEKTSRILSYAFITATPILCFLYYCYLKTGNPLNFLNFSDYEVASANEMFKPEFLGYINRAFYIFPSSILSVGVISSIWIYGKKRYTYIHSIILISFFISIYKLFNYTLMNDPRYFLLFECWFLFLSFGFVSDLCKDKWSPLIIYVLLIWVTGIYQTKNYIGEEIDNHPIQFSIQQKMLFRYIKDSHTKNRRYFVGNGMNFLQSAITYNTGIESSTIKCYSPERFWLGQVLTFEKFRSCIEEKNINTIISFPSYSENYGNLSRMIDSKEGQELMLKHGFKLIYEINGYRVHGI